MLVWLIDGNSLFFKCIGYENLIKEYNIFIISNKKQWSHKKTIRKWAEIETKTKKYQEH